VLQEICKKKKNNEKKDSHQYTVLETTELGFTLQWNMMNMKSSIVRGMPYATMEYEDRKQELSNGRVILPTIASSIPLGKTPVVDGKNKLICSAKHPKKTLVQKEIQLYFLESDYSWFVFFSEPVWIECTSHKETGQTYLQVVQYEHETSSDMPFVIRTALLDSCRYGKNQQNCKKDAIGNILMSNSQREDYSEVLRKYVNYYPGRYTSVQHEIGNNEAKMVFNWDVQSMQQGDTKASLRKSESEKISPDSNSLIMFALPHHLDKIDSAMLTENKLYCKSSMPGPACLVTGSSWSITESLPSIALRAPRPPKPQFIPQLAEFLIDDLDYDIPDFFRRGAGDTYFSGKMLAKLGRILVVADEINEICHDNSQSAEYADYCQNSTLPSTDQMTSAIDRLRSRVEVWINGKAESPFVYDAKWGGLVNCGCNFNGDGCDNQIPDCPAFSDQGLNFGNGFYNDQHFHYGYHIYAASVVAYFDPGWGRDFFEQVLLYIRSIANPSKHDTAFPLFRHKDWYQGSSWASGVPRPPYLNGKNQESTSEAIAGYEAVALYGKVMTTNWKLVGDSVKADISNEVRKVGQLMTATEIRSTQRYWHVLQNDESKRVYPKAYGGNVVGILWSTMAQFGTWFGASPYLPFGIQLLPLTAISEERDDLKWVNEMYYPFSEGCSQSSECIKGGWSILQLAILATVGYPEEAAKGIVTLPDDSFTNSGGNGHSRSNTLWYVATRPDVTNPVPKARQKKKEQGSTGCSPCSLEECDSDINQCPDKAFVCMEGASIGGCSGKPWLIDGVQCNACCETSSCHKIVSGDSQKVSNDANVVEESSNDAPLFVLKNCDTPETCTEDILDRKAGQYTCRERISWLINTMKKSQQEACSTVSKREYPSICGPCNPANQIDEPTEKKSIGDGKKKDGDRVDSSAQCSPCTPKECKSDLNRCPIYDRTFVCTRGESIGGCSENPWLIDEAQCNACCEMTSCQK